VYDFFVEDVETTPSSSNIKLGVASAIGVLGVYVQQLKTSMRKTVVQMCTLLPSHSFWRLEQVCFSDRADGSNICPNVRSSMCHCESGHTRHWLLSQRLCETSRIARTHFINSHRTREWVNECDSIAYMYLSPIDATLCNHPSSD